MWQVVVLSGEIVVDGTVSAVADLRTDALPPVMMPTTLRDWFRGSGGGWSQPRGRVCWRLWGAVDRRWRQTAADTV
jgi:hypothetical protein